MVLLPRLARRVAQLEPVLIIAMGSSTTEGVGATSPANSYPARLQDYLSASLRGGVRVVNRGVGGEAAAELLARIDRDALSLDPDLVLWQTGTNDPLRQAPLDGFDADTRLAMSRFIEARTDVVLIEPQWCPALDQIPAAPAFRECVRHIGDELRIPVIHRHDLMLGWIEQGRVRGDEIVGPDGLHMTDLGYDLIAREIASQLLDWVR